MAAANQKYSCLIVIMFLSVHDGKNLVKYEAKNFNEIQLEPA